MRLSRNSYGLIFCFIVSQRRRSCTTIRDSRTVKRKSGPEPNFSVWRTLGASAAAELWQEWFHPLEPPNCKRFIYRLFYNNPELVGRRKDASRMQFDVAVFPVPQPSSAFYSKRNPCWRTSGLLGTFATSSLTGIDGTRKVSWMPRCETSGGPLVALLSSKSRFFATPGGD